MWGLVVCIYYKFMLIINVINFELREWMDRGCRDQFTE